MTQLIYYGLASWEEQGTADPDPTEFVVEVWYTINAYDEPVFQAIAVNGTDQHEPTEHPDETFYRNFPSEAAADALERAIAEATGASE